MDYGLRGVDTYTYNGSVWLIFTDTKQWVLELTSEKTLWYNYSFFKELFCVATSDVISQDKFITEWVEKNMIKKPFNFNDIIEDTIENGVKETFNFDEKHTLSYEQGAKKLVEDAIQNGVKKTLSGLHIPGAEKDVNHIIENGVIETLGWDESIRGKLNVCVSNVVKNGVRETKTPGNGDLFSTFQWMNENKTESVPEMIDDIIENGVKKTLNTEYMPQVMVEDTIQNGTKNPSV